MNPKPAAGIVPTYLHSDRAKFVSLIESYMAFLPKKSQNRILNALRKPQNGLFAELYPHLLDVENGSYICLSKDQFLHLKSQDKVERVLRHGLPPDMLQERFCYFTNPMTLCALQNGVYCGLPPSQRIVNRGLVVLTFEYDPAINKQEFFDSQIRWSIAGTSGNSPFDRLYARLCSFQDFRLVEVVWSGHKSFHIHCLLDSRHLNRNQFAGEVTVPAGSWPEIPNNMLRSGLMGCWAPVEQIVRETLEIEIEPDRTLNQPDKYRRLPCGVRVADADNIFGFPPGTRCPQIVMYSKGRAYARAGNEWLLDPPKFLIESRRPRKAPCPVESSPPRGSLDRATQQALLAEIAQLCERLFGPPTSAPSPTGIDRSGDDWLIRFQNNAQDQNPGSAMVGHFRTILVGSKDPEILGRRYEFPLSANELVEIYLANHTLKDLPVRRLSWWERLFCEQMDQLCASDIECNIQDELRPYLKRTTAPQLNVIASAEGIGKTKGIMDEMLGSDEERMITVLDDLVEPSPGKLASRETHPPSGFLVVACRSYEQAEKKCAEFNSQMASGAAFHGVVVHSFERALQEIFPGKSINREWAAHRGFKTAMEAVHSDPVIGSKLDERRWQIQAELGWADPERRTDHARRSDIVIFTVHAVVQNWYRETGTRFWIHPLFESWASARAVDDFDAARQIAKQIQEETQLSWVLHDEIGMSDLMVQHEKAKVDAVTQFVRCADQQVATSRTDKKQKRFDEMPLPIKLELFERWVFGCQPTQSVSSPVTFDEMLQIHEVGYTDEDLRIVSPDLEPFGINNSPDSPYLAIRGQQWYAKRRDWWMHNRYKLTVTTTERKILTAFDHIRDQQVLAIEQDPDYGPRLRTWRAETAPLGPDDSVPPKPETPRRFLPLWRVNEYPATDYLPVDRLKV